MLEHERAQLQHRLADPLALNDLARLVRVLDEVVDERVDPPRPVSPRISIGSLGQVDSRDHTGAHRVVDVVVDVRDAVHQPDDPALERRRLGGAPGMAEDPVADRPGQVEALTVALERVDDAQRVLVVLEAKSEPLAQAAVERLLADVAERRVPEVVAKPDRLDQVLVEPQRAGNRARDLRDLERVGQPRAVVVAARRDEHLRLVLEASERLAVHDPVAIALKRRPQAAVRLRPGAQRRVGARRQRRERRLLTRADAPLEIVGHRPVRMGVAGCQGLLVHSRRF